MSNTTEIAENGLIALISGHAEKLAELLSDDVHIEVLGTSRLSGEWNGRYHALTSWFSAYGGAQSGGSVRTVENVNTEDGRSFIRAIETIDFDGTLSEHESLTLTRVVDGRIVDIHKIYVDTHAIPE